MTSSETDSLVWHYTDANGLMGMIKDRQVWATHFRFLNDSQEGWFLDKPLTDFLENDEPMSSSERDFIWDMLRPYVGQPITRMTKVPDGNHFLLCGSTSGDELTLWRNYARDAVSFAVGLDPQSPLGLVPPDKDVGITRHEMHPWRKVEYHSPETYLPTAYARRIREAVSQEDMGDRIVDVSDELTHLYSTVKSAAFKDERESRIVCVTNNTQLWRFRVSSYGITPYVALGGSDTWSGLSNGKIPLPIRAIRLSSNSTAADHLALNALLEHHGFRGDAKYEEIYDDTGRHVDTIYEEHEPPVQLLQSSNSLRH